MIYRLKPELALQQSVWLIVGLATFVLVLVGARRYKRLSDTSTS